MNPLMSFSACVLGDRLAVKEDAFDGDAVENDGGKKKRRREEIKKYKAGWRGEAALPARRRPPPPNWVDFFSSLPAAS